MKNKKIQITLIAVVISIVALYGYVWHQSKGLFERVASDYLADVSNGVTKKYTKLSFSHGLFSHTAVIENISIDNASKQFYMSHQGELLIKSNLIFNNVQTVFTGKMDVINRADKSIHTHISSDKIISNIKYKINFAKALKFLFIKNDESLAYAKKHLLGASKKPVEEVMALDVGDKAALTREELSKFLSELGHISIEANNLELSRANTDIKCEKCIISTDILEGSLPNIKSKVKLSLNNLKMSNGKEVEEMFADIMQPFSGGALSYDEELDVALYYVDNKEFDLAITTKDGIFFSNAFSFKGSGDYKFACKKDTGDCTFGMKSSDDIKFSEQFYEAVIKLLALGFEKDLMLNPTKADKSNYLSFARDITPKLHEYSSLLLKIEFSGVISDAEDIFNKLKSLEIKEFSLTTPPYSYGIANFEYKKAQDNKPSIIKGEIVMDAFEALIKDFGNYTERLLNALHQMPQLYQGIETWPKVKGKQVTDFLRVVFTYVANKPQSGSDKLVIEFAGKDHTPYLGTKSVMEFEMFIGEEFIKAFPKSKPQDMAAGADKEGEKNSNNNTQLKQP